MPFIAITEWAFTQLVNEGYSVLERGIEVHALLEGLVLAERGPRRDHAGDRRVGRPAPRCCSTTAASSSPAIRRSAASPSAAVADIRAEVNERAEAGRQAMFVAETGSLAGRAVAVPVPIGGARDPRALARRSPAEPARSATSSACSPARRRWSSRSS